MTLQVELSRFLAYNTVDVIYSGAVAERLRRGLQNLLRQFDSGRRLHIDLMHLMYGQIHISAGDGIGRHATLKMSCPQGVRVRFPPRAPQEIFPF